MLSTDGGTGRQLSQRMDCQLERHRRLRSLSSYYFERGCRQSFKRMSSLRELLPDLKLRTGIAFANVI